MDSILYTGMYACVNRNLCISGKLKLNSIIEKLGISGNQECSNKKLVSSVGDFIENTYKLV